MLKSTPAALAGLATIALVGGTALTFTPSNAAEGNHPTQQEHAASARATGPVKCDGGAALGLSTRLSADPFSFDGTSNSVIPVTGAKVTLKGPKHGTDTVLVTFSAETYYSGSGWMTLETHKDGVPIAPFANNGSPYAFTSAAAYAGNSAQFCTKIGRGLHTLSVNAGTTGGSGEFGWIDDWTMSVQRFN